MSTHLTVKELPESERPYEKAWSKGISWLSDAELLAIIIRSGSNKKRSIDLAYDVLNHKEGYPGLLGLCHTSVEELMKIKGIGKVKAVEILAVVELSKRLSKSNREEHLLFTSPQTIAQYYMERLRHEKREKTILILLDGKNAFIHDLVLSEGTVNASFVSTREIFMEAVRYEAVSIVLLHNHPSGDPSPSRQDLESTRVILEAGEMMDIHLLDHIIIGDRKYVSFKEQKLL